MIWFTGTYHERKALATGCWRMKVTKWRGSRKLFIPYTYDHNVNWAFHQGRVEYWLDKCTSKVPFIKMRLKEHKLTVLYPDTHNHIQSTFHQGEVEGGRLHVLVTVWCQCWSWPPCTVLLPTFIMLSILLPNIVAYYPPVHCTVRWFWGRGAVKKVRCTWWCESSALNRKNYTKIPTRVVWIKLLQSVSHQPPRVIGSIILCCAKNKMIKSKLSIPFTCPSHGCLRIFCWGIEQGGAPAPGLSKAPGPSSSLQTSPNYPQCQPLKLKTNSQKHCIVILIICSSN